jgi:hypothetical protein
VTTSSTINKDFIIPLPTGIDLSDETVIYRLKAEILEKSGGSPSLIATMLAYADPIGSVSESYSQLDFQYPVGTVATLATSVQQQKNTNNAPPVGNYTRQLVRVMSGADPVVKFAASVLAYGTAATVPPAHYKVRLTLEKLEAAAASPPAAVRYRDPADGQFKPLSQIGAHGYPAAAPDYSQAGIQYVDHPLTTGAAAVGTVPGGWQQPDKPSEAGGTVTTVAGGMRYQMNAPGGGTDYFASAEVPIVPPLPITHADDRTYSFVSTAAVASWNANGGMWTMNLYLVSDGGSANIGTVTQAGGEIRPSSPIGAATLKAIMDGANLRVRAMVTVSVFSGVAPAFVADVTLTNFRIHAQEVVAP